MARGGFCQWGDSAAGGWGSQDVCLGPQEPDQHTLVTPAGGRSSLPAVCPPELVKVPRPLLAKSPSTATWGSPGKPHLL